nr:hypothetical protein HCBNPDKA_00004 [Methanosarcinales archaeon ANME-2c ERB4]
MRYPGKEGIENYVSLLKRLLNVTDPSSFLETVAEARDELVGMHQKVEPVMSFFGSVQVEIFRRLSMEVGDFRRNIQFLSEDARSDVVRIEEIFSLDEPYSQIKDLTQLESRIKASLEESLLNLKQELHEKLISAMEDIERELASYDGLSDEFKRLVMKPFDDIKRDIATSDDCVFVKLQSTRINDLCGSAYEKIKRQVRIIKEIDATPVVIQGTALFRTKKNIETEDDLDEYLENLRAAMRTILNEKNKIKVL